MTLQEFLDTSKNEKLNEGIRHAVKDPNCYEVLGTYCNKDWFEIDIKGLKSKSEAKIRVQA